MKTLTAEKSKLTDYINVWPSDYIRDKWLHPHQDPDPSWSQNWAALVSSYVCHLSGHRKRTGAISLESICGTDD